MALIVAFGVAVVVTPVVAWVARRLGVVDRPGPLKVHTRPVPYLGGVAVFVALAGPVAVERPVLLVPLMLSLVLGLADDLSGHSPPMRLRLEVAIGITAALVVWARGPAGALVAVVCVVGLLNAVNLLDGLDGLAPGVCLMSAVGFAFALDGEFRVLALALAGGLAGLLLWNRPPARIYLGDAGSYMIGTTLAVLLAAAFDDGQPVALATGSLLFVAVPVADTAVAIVRRLRAGRPLFYGDRGHIYDQLVDRGWSPVIAVGTCIGVQALLVAIGIGVVNLPAVFAVCLTVPLVAIIGGLMLVVFTSPGSWKVR